MSYSAALYSYGGTRHGVGAARQISPHPALPGAPRRSHSRNRLRLGRFRGNRRAKPGPVHGDLSPSQLAWAEERLRGRARWPVRLELRDYRDLSGGTTTSFRSKCSRRSASVGGIPTLASFPALKTRGRALIQTITIRDDLFARYRRGPISSSSTSFRGHAAVAGGVRRNAQRSGLAVRDAFAFGPDYARTPGRLAGRLRCRMAGNSAPGLPMNPSAACGASISRTARRIDSGCTDVHQFELMRD